MTKSVLVANGNNGATLASGDEVNLFGWGSDTTAEGNAQASCSEGATFSNLRMRIIAGGSGTNNLRFRDAGADGAQLATVAGAGDAEDAVNSDTLSAGDLFNLAYTDTGTSSNIAWVACNLEFASGYGAFHGSASFGGAICDAASATQYFPLAGLVPSDGLTNIADAQFKNRAYTSWGAMQVRVSANARTNASLFKNDINNGAGAGLCSFGAGATGLVEDTSVGDSLSDGDLLCHSITLDTGVEDLTVQFIVSIFKSTNTKQEIITYSAQSRAASATANYVGIGGYADALTAYTEAQARCKPGYAGTASNVRCYLSANTYGGNGTLKLYQNGSAVITVTLTAGGGGAWYENTGDSVSFDADDEFSFEFDEGTSGSITIRSVGMTLAPTVAGGFVRSPRGLDAGMHEMRGGMQ